MAERVQELHGVNFKNRMRQSCIHGRLQVGKNFRRKDGGDADVFIRFRRTKLCNDEQQELENTPGPSRLWQ
jgi:hypothetical protein